MNYLEDILHDKIVEALNEIDNKKKQCYEVVEHFIKVLMEPVCITFFPSHFHLFKTIIITWFFVLFYI